MWDRLAALPVKGILDTRFLCGPRILRILIWDDCDSVQ